LSAVEPQLGDIALAVGHLGAATQRVPDLLLNLACRIGNRPDVAVGVIAQLPDRTGAVTFGHAVTGPAVAEGLGHAAAGLAYHVAAVVKAEVGGRAAVVRGHGQAIFDWALEGVWRVEQPVALQAAGRMNDGLSNTIAVVIVAELAARAVGVLLCCRLHHRQVPFHTLGADRPGNFNGRDG